MLYTFIILNDFYWNIIMSRDKKENAHKIKQIKFGIKDVYKRYALLELVSAKDYAKKNLKFKINGSSICLEAFMTQAIRDACFGLFIINYSIL